MEPLAGQRLPDPETVIIFSDLKRQIRRALGYLDEEQRAILTTRFGLDDGKFKSYPQTLEVLGLDISPQSLRNKEQVALARVRRRVPELHFDVYEENNP